MLNEPLKRCGCGEGHATFGACLRAKRFQVDTHGLQNRDAEKDKDKRLSRYEDARRQGLQPKNTNWDSIRSAFESGGRAHTPVTATE